MIMKQQILQQTEQGQDREVVTEKNVTEVAVCMQFLGLEFRKTSSVEKQYSKYASRDKADRQLQATASGEMERKAEEVLLPSRQLSISVQDVKGLQTYLLGEPKKDGLCYLA